MGNVVITSAVRTAVGAYLGSLKTVPPEDLVKPVLEDVLKRSGITPDEVDHVILGDVLSHMPNIARVASLKAGYNVETPAFTVDRQCSSSLQAVVSAVQSLKAGDDKVVVAGGVESMSRAPYYMARGVHILKVHRAIISQAVITRRNSSGAAPVFA